MVGLRKYISIPGLVKSEIANMCKFVVQRISEASPVVIAVASDIVLLRKGDYTFSITSGVERV